MKWGKKILYDQMFAKLFDDSYILIKWKDNLRYLQHFFLLYKKTLFEIF